MPPRKNDYDEPDEDWSGDEDLPADEEAEEEVEDEEFEADDLEEIDDVVEELEEIDDVVAIAIVDDDDEDEDDEEDTRGARRTRGRRARDAHRGRGGREPSRRRGRGDPQAASRGHRARGPGRVGRTGRVRLSELLPGQAHDPTRRQAAQVLPRLCRSRSAARRPSRYGPFRGDRPPLRGLAEEMAALRPVWPLVDGLADPMEAAFARMVDGADWSPVVGTLDGVVVGFLAWCEEPMLPQAAGGADRIGALHLHRARDAHRRCRRGDDGAVPGRSRRPRDPALRRPRLAGASRGEELLRVPRVQGALDRHAPGRRLGDSGRRPPLPVGAIPHRRPPRHPATGTIASPPSWIEAPESLLRLGDPISASPSSTSGASGGSCCGGRGRRWGSRPVSGHRSRTG